MFVIIIILKKMEILTVGDIILNPYLDTCLVYTRDMSTSMLIVSSMLNLSTKVRNRRI